MMILKDHRAPTPSHQLLNSETAAVAAPTQAGLCESSHWQLEEPARLSRCQKRKQSGAITGTFTHHDHCASEAIIITSRHMSRPSHYHPTAASAIIIHHGTRAVRAITACALSEPSRFTDPGIVAVQHTLERVPSRPPYTHQLQARPIRPLLLLRPALS
eukprot:1909109-Rhodomonas_salina.1